MIVSDDQKILTLTLPPTAKRLCRNLGSHIDVMLRPSNELGINFAKHFAFSSVYKGEILRLRLRMTLRHGLKQGAG